jgi:methylglutaconyl-CoA hydratase
VTTEPDCLLVEIVDGVANVTLNRPQVRNAFDEVLIARITEAFVALDADARVRVVVLGGHGKAFCAGADLNWMKRMADFTIEQNRADAERLAAMLDAVYRCSKPVVARVHGDVYAGGVGLVAASDIAIAASEVHFALSETRIGLIPATIAPYVVRAMGENACRRYMMTAERFTAAEAFRIGLVHDLCPADQLDEHVGEVVDALLVASPDAVTEAKRLIRDVAAMPITAELRSETANRIAAIRASEQGREGVRSFLEKRKPSWVTES